MQFNPREREEVTNNAGSASKRNSRGFTVQSMSLKQVAELMKEGTANSDRMCVVGRVISFREILNRTLVKVSDESAVVTMVDGQNSDLNEDEYYRFVVMIRVDKEEPIVFIQHSEPINNFNEIQYHMARVMEQSVIAAKHQN